MQNTKLTLSLSEEIVARAKKYAKTKGTSVSFMVERFLEQITKNIPVTKEESVTANPLKGIISLPKDYDYKQELSDIYSK